MENKLLVSEAIFKGKSNYFFTFFILIILFPYQYIFILLKVGPLFGMKINLSNVPAKSHYQFGFCGWFNSCPLFLFDPDISCRWKSAKVTKHVIFWHDLIRNNIGEKCIPFFLACLFVFRWNNKHMLTFLLDVYIEDIL